MSEYTKEPWKNVAFGEGHECDDWSADNDTAATTEVAAICANGKTVALVVSKEWDSRELNANVSRIVACVNACAGISTEFLEGWSAVSNQTSPQWDVRVERANDMEQQRDELLEALKIVDERFGKCRDQYIFSKRNALDKVKAAIAKAEA